jgi:gamma-glutamyltranspeptidase/glutathione hydrolase
MPVMIERDGELLGVLGTMGGKAQAQIHTQLLLALMDGASPVQAVAAPRFAVGAAGEGDPPGTVLVECNCDPAVATALSAAGMSPVAVPELSEDLGHAQVIWRGEPASDPRADGRAMRG